MSGVIFHFSKFLGTVHYNCFKICTFSYISSAILYNYSARKCCCWPLAAHRPAPKHVETIVCIWKQAQSLMTSATSVSNIYRYQALPLITDTNPKHLCTCDNIRLVLDCSACPFVCISFITLELSYVTATNSNFTALNVHQIEDSNAKPTAATLVKYLFILSCSEKDWV